MIGIINYGMGNLRSVQKAFAFLGYEAKIITDRREIMACNKIILPGVGAYADAIKNLKSSETDKAIKEFLASGKPYLGICLGMQLLFETSYENGEYDGLGVLPGTIARLEGIEKIPHIGWNLLDIKQPSALLNDLPQKPYVYFVHSYYAKTHQNIVSATTFYGLEFTVAVHKENIFAVQFHPEKSGDTGLSILKNFGGM